MQSAPALTATAITVRTGSKTFAIRYENGAVVDGYRSREAAVAAYYGDSRGWAIETVRAILHDDTATTADYRFADWAFETYQITTDEIRSAR